MPPTSGSRAINWTIAALIAVLGVAALVRTVPAAVAETDNVRYAGHPDPSSKEPALWVVDGTTGKVAYLTLQYKDGKWVLEKRAELLP